jgi:hypothetical protein
MVYSRYIFVASWVTLTLVLCSSIVSAEPLKSGSRSLIHRPQLQSTPSATLDLTVGASHSDQSSPDSSTPRPSLRHKLVKRPATPPLAAVQPNDALPTNPLQLDDTSSSTKQ